MGCSPQEQPVSFFCPRTYSPHCSCHARSSSAILVSPAAFLALLLLYLGLPRVIIPLSAWRVCSQGDELPFAAVSWLRILPTSVCGIPKQLLGMTVYASLKKERKGESPSWSRLSAISPGKLSRIPLGTSILPFSHPTHSLICQHTLGCTHRMLVTHTWSVCTSSVP